MQPLPYEILGHNAVREMVPDIGPQVVGASYCPIDGHCNSMRLFWALHSAFQKAGGYYLSNCRVASIAPSESGSFRLDTAGGPVAAGKVVIAAGNDNGRLAPMVGLNAAVRPQRGQVIVTERVKPFLRYPTITVRQSDEGTVMLWRLDRGRQCQPYGRNRCVGQNGRSRHAHVSRAGQCQHRPDLVGAARHD